MLFSLLAIFILVSVSFFASLRLIDFILAVGAKPKSVRGRKILTLVSLLGLFVAGLATTLWLSTILVKIPTSSSLESTPKPLANRRVLLSQEDCPTLIDTVYNTENAIYRLENHRQIESSSLAADLANNYLKGAQHLNQVAQKYQGLPVTVATKSYTWKAAGLLQKKADLFQERINLQNTKSSDSKVESLLQQMDLVTEERQSLISALEEQCVLAN